MPGLYDLMLMLDPAAEEARRSQIASNVQQMIESSGSLVAVHDWGTRTMTFEIRHQPEAAYLLYQFEGGNDLLDELNHQLKIADGVLRFRIIRIKPGTPTPAPPRPDGPRPRDAGGKETVAPRAAADAPAPDDEP